MMVMLVEDEHTERLVISRLLRKVGCEIVLAENGLEALAIISRGMVDLVILDLLMPVMDGLDMIRRIRSGDAGTKCANLPIIVRTAANYLLPEAMNAGANVALEKSAEFPVLFQHVERLLLEIGKPLAASP